jgi:hypothetical protein
LAILGLPWLHPCGSVLLGFVKDDATWLADRLDAARRNEHIEPTVAA